MVSSVLTDPPPPVGHGAQRPGEENAQEDKQGDHPGAVARLGHRAVGYRQALGPAGQRLERLRIRRAQLTCDVFMTGSNAVTMDGKLVNVDGTGNRVAAMIFGPEKVIVVAGINKIVRDLDAAEERIRSVAAPVNNSRIGLPNPCVKTGECMDCQGPTRICNVTTIIGKRPNTTEMHVVIVGEDMGF